MSLEPVEWRQGFSFQMLKYENCGSLRCPYTFALCCDAEIVR